jgi:hypothetical protein
MTDRPSGKYPFAEQGNRLRILRKAENMANGSMFAARLNWPQSAYSQFETGMRQIPLAKVQAMVRQIPGFDPQWLWSGDKRGLSWSLRQRIEAVELTEASDNGNGGTSNLNGNYRRVGR